MTKLLTPAGNGMRTDRLEQAVDDIYPRLAALESATPTDPTDPGTPTDITALTALVNRIFKISFQGSTYTPISSSNPTPTSIIESSSNDWRSLFAATWGDQHYTSQATWDTYTEKPFYNQVFGNLGLWDYFNDPSVSGASLAHILLPDDPTYMQAIRDSNPTIGYQEGSDTGGSVLTACFGTRSEFVSGMLSHKSLLKRIRDLEALVAGHTSDLAYMQSRIDYIEDNM